MVSTDMKMVSALLGINEIDPKEVSAEEWAEVLIQVARSLPFEYMSGFGGISHIQSRLCEQTHYETNREVGGNCRIDFHEAVNQKQHLAFCAYVEHEDIDVDDDTVHDRALFVSRKGTFFEVSSIWKTEWPDDNVSTPPVYLLTEMEVQPIRLTHALKAYPYLPHDPDVLTAVSILKKWRRALETDALLLQKRVRDLSKASQGLTGILYRVNES